MSIRQNVRGKMSVRQNSVGKIPATEKWMTLLTIDVNFMEEHVKS
jgi:hypothetical protein